MSLLRQRARSLWRAFGAAAAAASLAWAAAAVSAQEHKVLRVARTSQFDTLDPPRQFDGSSVDLITLVYSGLMRYAYLERPYMVEPDLLARMHEARLFRLLLPRMRIPLRYRMPSSVPRTVTNVMLKTRSLLGFDVASELNAAFSDAVSTSR